MSTNKIEFFGKVLLDLTSDTVTAENLLKGITAHDATGAKITGTLENSGGGGGASNIEVVKLAPTEDGVVILDNLLEEPSKVNIMLLVRENFPTTVCNRAIWASLAMLTDPTRAYVIGSYQNSTSRVSFSTNASYVSSSTTVANGTYYGSLRFSTKAGSRLTALFETNPASKSHYAFETGKPHILIAYKGE